MLIVSGELFVTLIGEHGGEEVGVGGAFVGTELVTSPSSSPPEELFMRGANADLSLADLLSSAPLSKLAERVRPNCSLIGRYRLCRGETSA